MRRGPAPPEQRPGLETPRAADAGAPGPRQGPPRACCVSPPQAARADAGRAAVALAGFPMHRSPCSRQQRSKPLRAQRPRQACGGRLSDLPQHSGFESKALCQASSLNPHLLFRGGMKFYKWKECGKILRCNSKLLRHQRNHTREKPFKCKDCGKAFESSYALSAFPGGSDGKEPGFNAGDPGSVPRLGRSPGGGNGTPLQYCLENPHGQRSLVGYSPWGRKESDTTERLHFHFYDCIIHEKIPRVSPGRGCAAGQYKSDLHPKPFQHSSHLASPPCVASVLQVGGAPTESLPHSLHAQGFSPVQIL